MFTVHPRTMKRLAMVMGPAGFCLIVVGWLGASLIPALESVQTLLLLSGIASIVLSVRLYRSHQRAVWRQMGLQGFSFCGACNYPFDETLPDDAVVTCSECGKRFRAGDSREWFRDLAK